MCENYERNADYCNHEVRHDAGKRHDYVALLEVPVVARIYGNRFGPAEYRRPGDIEQQRQDDRHERIDMLCRIPGEPSELIRRHISVFEGSISMGVFVRHHGEEQNGCYENEILR
jgi:hypothetical protein